jgi:hypothetical protein
MCVVLEARVLDSRAYFELFTGVHNNATFNDLSDSHFPGRGPSFGKY